MLKIELPFKDEFDESTERWVTTEAVTLQLEHSLVSLREWESKYHKPFLGKEEHSVEEFMSYLKFMDLDEHEDEVYRRLTNTEIEKIADYIQDKRTASWISEKPGQTKSGNKGEQVTAELIYYWMISLNIPIEWENRHLNQLMMLIQVCSAKNAPPTKMTKQQSAAWMHQQNELRKRKYNTRG